jgi:hypothetical protein
MYERVEVKLHICTEWRWMVGFISWLFCLMVEVVQDRGAQISGTTSGKLNFINEYQEYFLGVKAAGS